MDLGAYDEGEALIGAIVDSVTWTEWRAGDDVLFLFLDGLDEALLHIKPIHRRLIIELSSIGEDIARLRLRISCRTAEWIADIDTRLSDSTDCRMAHGGWRSHRCGSLMPPRQPAARASTLTSSSPRFADATSDG